MSRNLAVRPVLIYTMPEPAHEAATREIVGLVEAGRLLHQIGARFALAETVEAHETQEAGKVLGNIVVRVAADPA